MNLVAVLGSKCPATVALMAGKGVGLDVGLEIGFNGVVLGAVGAIQVLGTVLAVKVFLDAGDVAESTGAIVVDTGGDGADVGLAACWHAAGLPEFPVHVVGSHVEQQILITLESLTTHVADKLADGQ